MTAGPEVAAERARAQALIERLWAPGSGCLSVQVLQECFNTVTRKLSTPLNADQAYRLVQNYAAWTVHAPDPSDVLAVIRIHREHGISFWDALSVRSAPVLGCTILWTQDLNHGQVMEGVKVSNPFL